MLHVRAPSTHAEITALDEKLAGADTATLAPFLHERRQTTETLPYWLVNLPRSQWPVDCPSFLRDQPPKNIRCLSTPDHLYTRQDWEQVKEIISEWQLLSRMQLFTPLTGIVSMAETNRIDRFQRVPSELRKYLEYMAHIKAEYGGVMRFIVKERLGWGDGDGQDVKPRGQPFEYDDDLRIIYNDWPYGVDKDIIHLVVWTKFELKDDPATGYLTASAQAAIESYVQVTFCSRVPPEQVVWFKNWKSLKSVPGLEHFHVMLHRPDMEFVREITRGDVPLINRV
ncbi:hypothetical protein N7457_008359 [Penicillium paradoxum]|uniref:uncharacterized protein n=1 Tax=Penicillium paradoxum TaxID=176176 RepID=UPI0025497676|nr:uncharacterized protein N7457_008359 [Penicillium paradoxum]KAJ5773463.1 hypothetical protein N7457_008359 [Penicillium paradoxum]